MSRSDKVYLIDILESVDDILTYIEDKTESDFLNNKMMRDAVIRRFEIIGEASSKLSDLIKTKHPEVRWKTMKLMRNKMIHEYFGVSNTIVFETAKFDLPILKEQLQKIT